MKTNVRYSLYGLVVLACVGFYVRSAPAAADKIVEHAQTKKPAAINPDDDPDAADTSVPPRFVSPTAKLRNIFMPLIKSGKKENATATPAEDLVKIPASVSGDGNWVYTGLAIIDKVKMALLENTSNHQSGFVKEGETWKKSKLLSVTQKNIVFLDRDGVEQTVYRFNPDDTPKPKPEPASGFQPVEPPSPRRGRGPNIEMRAEASPAPMQDGPIRMDVRGG